MDEYDIIGALYDDDDDEGYVGADDYDVIGEDWDDDDVIEGAEQMDIVGARRPRRRKIRRRGRVAREVLARAAAVVQGSPLTSRRRYLLGFAITPLTAGASQDIPGQPQNLFRGERLVIPSDIGFDIGIEGITVGTQSQFAQSVEVPGAVFSEVAVNTEVMFDTAQIGNQISINARNKGADTLNFTAAMLGTLAKK